MFLNNLRVRLPITKTMENNIFEVMTHRGGILGLLTPVENVKISPNHRPRKLKTLPIGNCFQLINIICCIK